MSLGIKKDIAVIDFETTGFSPYKAEITEIGVVIIDGDTGEEKLVYSTLVQVEGDVPPKITELTGITKEKLDKYGIPFEEAKSQVQRLLEDNVVVAHNIAFDGEWLDVKFGITPKVFYDTLSIDRLEFPKERGHKLEDICYREGIKLSNAHTAIHDVFATVEVLKKQLSRGDNKRRYLNVLTENQYGLNYKLKHTVRVEPC